MIRPFSYYTSYKIGDMVSYKNNIYRALSASSYNYPESNTGVVSTRWEKIPSTTIGNVFLANQGTYVSTNTYNKLDVVSQNGKRFVAKLNVAANLAPPTTGTGNTYWLLIASSGNYTPILDSNGILWQ